MTVAARNAHTADALRAAADVLERTPYNPPAFLRMLADIYAPATHGPASPGPGVPPAARAENEVPT